VGRAAALKPRHRRGTHSESEKLVIDCETDRIQKTVRHLNPVKSLVQQHQTRMTLSFPTVPSAPPSESEKCPFNNVNCSHLTTHSFVE
jgi:hypothetical protein